MREVSEWFYMVSLKAAASLVALLADIIITVKDCSAPTYIFCCCTDAFIERRYAPLPGPVIRTTAG